MKLEQPLSKKQWKEFFSHEYYRLGSEEIDSKFYKRKKGGILEYKYRLRKDNGIIFGSLDVILERLTFITERSKERLYWVDIPEKEHVIEGFQDSFLVKRVIEGDYIDLRELHLSKVFPKQFYYQEFMEWIRTKKLFSLFLKSRRKSSVIEYLPISLDTLFKWPWFNDIIKNRDVYKLTITVDAPHTPDKMDIFAKDEEGEYLLDEKYILLEIPSSIGVINLIKVNNRLFYTFLRLYLPNSNNIHSLYPSSLKSLEKRRKDSLYRALIKYGTENMDKYGKYLFIYHIISCNIAETKRISKIKKWIDTPEDVRFLLRELTLNLCEKAIIMLTDNSNFFAERVDPSDFSVFIKEYLYILFNSDKYDLHSGGESPTEKRYIILYRDNTKIIKTLLERTSKFKRLYTKKLIIDICKFLYSSDEIMFMDFFVSLHERKSKYKWNYIKWSTSWAYVKRKTEGYLILARLFEF